MKAAVVGALDIEHMGGGEGNAVMISNLLIKRGYDVKYFGSGCPVNNSIGHRPPQINFDYEPSSFPHDPMTMPFVLRTSRLLSLGIMGIVNFRKTYNKVRGYHLYYFQNPTYLVRKLIPILLRQGSKVIIANHGTYYEYLGHSRSFFLRLLSRLATKFIIEPLKPYKDEIIIHTQNMFQTAFYLKNGFCEENILEIPQHNVDMSLYRIEQVSTGFNVAFLGRLTESKGLDILPNIIKMNPNMTFHIIGNGPLMTRLKDTHLPNNAILHGFVAEENKRDILAQCDAMIIPSYFESLSIATIEGLSSGLPVIGSDTASGLRYIISKDSSFGVLVPREAEAFTTSLKEFMTRKESHPDLFKRDRIERRSRAIANFDNEILTMKLIHMVNRTVDGPQKFALEEVETLTPA